MALGLSWTALAFGGGYLIAALGYRILFLLAAALTAGGTLLFGIVFRRHEGSGLSTVVEGDPVRLVQDEPGNAAL